MEQNLTEVYKRLQEKIVGRKREIKNILAAIRVGRNMVLEGAPGTSKSTILKEITEQIAIPFFMIEGSAELTPAKLIGSHNPAEVMSAGYTPESFNRGPLTQAMIEGGFLYIEEFNRIPEDVMNVLIRAMDERKIVIPRVGEIVAASTFRLIAAMNPFDDVGTERISRAISDRFCRWVLDYQSEGEEISVVRQKSHGDPNGLARLAVKLVRGTRAHPEVKMGSSVRGAIDMVLVSEELLRLDGIHTQKEMIDHYDLGAKDSILDAALMALSSKVWVKETSEKTPEEIIQDIWDQLHTLYLPVEPDGEKTPTDGAHGDDGEQGEGAASQDQQGGERTEGGMPQGQVDPNATAQFSALEQMISGASDADQGQHMQLPPQSLDNFLQNLPYPDRYAGGDSEGLRAAKEMALDMVLEMPKVERVSRTSYGDFKPTSFDFASDELELDRTVERIAGKMDREYRDFVVMERKQERKAYSLIIDASGSMKGENILRAAIAVTTLVNNLGKDDFSIVAFSERAKVIKFMNAAKDLRTLINDIFDAFIGGMTDISIGLKSGLEELYRSHFKKKVGIILTDGAHNKRSDPLSQAKKFPKLSVIGIKPPWDDAEDRCRKMAQLGRGRCLFINEVREIPAALMTCLADASL